MKSNAKQKWNNFNPSLGIVLRLFLSLVFIQSLFAFAQSAATGASNTYRIAISDFSVSAADGATADPNIAAIMFNQLKYVFTDAPRFNVVEINKDVLNDLIQEVARSEEGQVNPEQRQEFGNFSGVSLIVSGTIIVYPSFYEVTIFYTEVASRQFLNTYRYKTNGVSTTTLSEAAQAMIENANNRFPLIGGIVRDGDDIYINLGFDQGLTDKDNTGIIFRDRIVAGNVIPQEIGTFIIKRKLAPLSLIEPTMNPGFDLQEGDRVAIQTIAVGEQEAVVTESELGTLELTTNIKSQVYLNGEFKGESPLMLEGIASGTYELGLNAEGYETLTEIIEIKANKTLTIEKSLKQRLSILNLAINETNYEVKINGESQGQKPSFSLTPGTYKVEVSAPGKAVASFQVILIAGDKRELNIDLQASPASLKLQLNPANAALILNGESYSNTTSPLELPAGTYSLEVTAEGYAPYQESLTLEAGTAQTRTISLEALAATLILSVNQETFEVMLDGQAQGQVRSLVLSPNTPHTLIISSSNTVPESFEVTLKEGQTETRTINLTRLSQVLLHAPVGTDVAIQKPVRRFLEPVASNPQVYLLEPGSYELIITPPDGNPQRLTIEVSADPAMQDIYLPTQTQTEVPTEPSTTATQSETTAETANPEPINPQAAVEINPEPEVSTETPASQEPETAEPSSNSETQALAENQGRIELHSNIPNVLVVFESIKGSQELQLSNLQGGIDLPDGIYSYKASVAGAKTIDDVIFVSRGQTEVIELVFQQEDVSITMGTYNNQGSIEVLLLASMNAQDNDYKLNLSGSALVDGQSPFVTSFAKGTTYVWLEGIAAKSASFQANLNSGSITNLPIDFSLDAVTSLAPAKNLETNLSDLNTLSISWQLPEGGVSSQVSLYRGGNLVKEASTQGTSLNLTSLNLNPGEQYLACVQVQNWQLNKLDSYSSIPMASRVCNVVSNVVTPVTPSKDDDTKPPCLIPGKC